MAMNHANNISMGRRIGDVEIGLILIGAALFCFLASIFFGGIMPMANTVRYVSIAAVDAIVLLRLFRRDIRLQLLPGAAIFLCFLCYIVVNRGFSLITGGGWLALFGLCFIAAVLLRYDTVDWISVAAKFVALFGLIHSIATIFFFVLPNLYSGWFKPHFYPDVVSAADYKSGLTNHYSTNCMYLAWGLITSFYFWQVTGRRCGRKWAVPVLMILVALLLTAKRLHLVAGVACCLIVYLLLNSGKGSFGTALKITAFAVVAIIALYVVSLSVPEIAGVVDRLADAGPETARLSYYDICLELFKSSPFVGHGWGSFTTTLYQSGISDLARLYRNGNLYQNAHNVYLQLLAEEGFIGLLLFLSAAATSLIFSLKAAFSKGCEIQRGLYALAVGIQIFFLLYCLTGNPLYDFAEYSVYLIIGVSWALSRPAGAGEMENPISRS